MAFRLLPLSSCWHVLLFRLSYSLTLVVALKVEKIVTKKVLMTQLSLDLYYLLVLFLRFFFPRNPPNKRMYRLGVTQMPPPTRLFLALAFEGLVLLFGTC